MACAAGTDYNCRLARVIVPFYQALESSARVDLVLEECPAGECIQFGKGMG